MFGKKMNLEMRLMMRVCVPMWYQTLQNTLYLLCVCMNLCMCTCCEKQFVCVFSLFFFLPAECGRWSQAQSDTAIKQHLAEMGWSPLHLWPSALGVSVAIHTCMCVRACVSYGPAEVLARCGQCGWRCQPGFSVRCAKKYTHAHTHISYKMQNKKRDSSSWGNICAR